MDGREWFEHALDPGWELRFEDVLGGDPILFPGYCELIAKAQDKTGESESLLVAEGSIGGKPVVATSSVFGFMGGSMGGAHGERMCRAYELATLKGLALVAFTASGGARMQEGMVALSQMPATLQSRGLHADAGLQQISVLRKPTTGGVFASYANAGDHLIALPGATIGFAGPRVAEALAGQPLQKGSHTAESALANGLVHEIASPEHVRTAILAALRDSGFPRDRSGLQPTNEPREPLPQEDSWAAVTSARDPERRKRLRDELPAIGKGSFEGRPAIIIDTDHASPGVDDFRIARKLFTLAETENLPIVVLVDMAGADPSAASEAAGIAREISWTITAALEVRTPTLGVILGQGGSGGAIALCAGADLLLACEGSYFSVIAPEGAATILRRDDVAQVANELRCGPKSLVGLGLADEVISDEGLSSTIAQALDGLKVTERSRWRRALGSNLR